MEHVTGSQRRAELLCKVPGRDTPVAHKDRSYFVDLFVNNNLSATMRFTWYAARPEPVNVGVLQWIIQGLIGLGPDGGIVKIPPRPPVNDILVGLAMFELVSHIEDAEEQLAAQRNSMRMIAQTAKKVGGKR